MRMKYFVVAEKVFDNKHLHVNKIFAYDYADAMKVAKAFEGDGRKTRVCVAANLFGKTALIPLEDLRSVASVLEDAFEQWMSDKALATGTTPFKRDTSA